MFYQISSNNFQISDEVLTYMVLALFVVVMVVLCIRNALIKSIEKKVNAESTKLKFLCSLNSKYNFDNLQKTYEYTYCCKSKRQFDQFNYDEYFRTVLKKHPELEGFALRANKNKDKYRNYLNDLRAMPETKYTKRIWIQIEQNFIEKNTLNPVTEFDVVIKWLYVSPKGRNRYGNYFKYASNQIPNYLIQVEKEEEEKSYRQNQIKKERAKMTPSLRYQILKRDNFTCQICGSRVSDGVKLEVDHIIPVSKGGKTVPSNLQVLCDRCNRGKSNKL